MGFTWFCFMNLRLPVSATLVHSLSCCCVPTARGEGLARKDTAEAVISDPEVVFAMHGIHFLQISSLYAEAQEARCGDSLELQSLRVSREKFVSRDRQEVSSNHSSIAAREVVSSLFLCISCSLSAVHVCIQVFCSPVNGILSSLPFVWPLVNKLLRV